MIQAIVLKTPSDVEATEKLPDLKKIQQFRGQL